MTPETTNNRPYSYVYADQPKPPDSMKGYDEDTGMMAFPASEDVTGNAVTLQYLEAQIEKAKAEHSVPQGYIAFIRPEGYGWYEIEEMVLQIWFGRPETEQELDARLEFQEARKQYWEEWNSRR